MPPCLSCQCEQPFLSLSGSFPINAKINSFLQRRDAWEYNWEEGYTVDERKSGSCLTGKVPRHCLKCLSHAVKAMPAVQQLLPVLEFCF